MYYCNSIQVCQAQQRVAQMLPLTSYVSVSSYVPTFNNLTTVECIFIKVYIGKIYENLWMHYGLC